MKGFLDGYCKFLKGVITLLLGFMIIPVFLQIVSRHTGIIPRYIWTEEVARFCFVWIIMIGSIIAVKESSHFDVDLLPKPKTNRSLALSRFVKHIAMLALAFVFAKHGLEFAQFGLRQNSEMSGINMMSIYISFPIAGISWTLLLIEKLIEDFKLFRLPDTTPAK